MTRLIYLLFSIITSCFIFANVGAHTVEIDSNLLSQVLSRLDTMQAKVDHLETFEERLKQTVADLLSTVAHLKKHINRLESSEERLKRTVRNVVGTSIKLRQEIENLGKESPEPEKNQIVENVSANLNSKDGNSELKIRKDLLKTGDDGRIGVLKRDIRQTSQQVAFSAYLDHVIRHLDQNQIIVHNRVLLNEAGAYSTNTGVFIVPISGIYLFSWSVTAKKIQGEHSYDIWVKLVVNGDTKLSTAAESREDYEDNQSSNTAALRLKQGDEVWTSNYESSDIFGSDTERTTSFTGVLLHAD